MPQAVVIGRLEYMEFLTLELPVLKAKVDTGAYRSSMHCVSVNEIEEEGKKVLHVHFRTGRKRNKRTFNKYSKTVVKSSNGETEERFVIQTSVRLGKKRYRASFTLSNRSEMKYPVLLGRKFLSGKFLVDVNKTYLLGNLPSI